MITSRKITFKELRNGTYKDAYISQNERFDGVASMTPYLRNALIACPYNNGDDKTAMFLQLDEGKEVGHCYMYGVKFRAGMKTYGAQVFYGLKVLEEYRNKGIGTSLIQYPLTNNEYDFVIIGGMTSMVISKFKKMKYHIFEVPQYVKILNSRYFLGSFSIDGLLLKVSTRFFNGILKIMEIPNKIKIKQLKKKFIIKKEAIVPDWAGELATNDGHKYMEVHDREWLQWNLNYNTFGYKEDIQSFYSVFDITGKPIGFFMTNERLKKTEGRIKNSIRGKLLEWGSYDFSVLCEADINLLALSTYSPTVDLVMSLANENDTKKKLKSMGFIQRGMFPIGIKDKNNLLNDLSNQSLWRLRFGYANTYIY